MHIISNMNTRAGFGKLIFETPNDADLNVKKQMGQLKKLAESDGNIKSFYDGLDKMDINVLVKPGSNHLSSIGGLNIDFNISSGNKTLQAGRQGQQNKFNKNANKYELDTDMSKLLMGQMAESSVEAIKIKYKITN